MGNLNAKAMNITKLDCFQLMSPSLPLVYLTMEHCTVRNLLQETLQTTSFQKFKKKKKIFFFLAILCGKWDLSSLARTEPTSSALGEYSLYHWTTREILKTSSDMFDQLQHLLHTLHKSFFVCVYFICIYFYLSWNKKVKVKSLSRVRLFATP